MSWRTNLRNPKNLGAIRSTLRGGGIAKRGTGVALKTGGRAALRFGGGRTDLLEELGRVEGEHSNRNRRAEIARVHSELNRGYAKGGRAGFEHGETVGRKKQTIDKEKMGAFLKGREPKWERKRKPGDKPKWERMPWKPGQKLKMQPLKKGGKADKNWIQKATASIKKRGTKGKCTPITKPGCTGRAKALAKTFKKMAARRKG